MKDKQIISKKHYEPITSHLTLGEMMAILKFDLSWGEKNLTVNDFQYLLSEAKTLEDVKSRLEGKTKRVQLWDLINEHVLESKVPFSDINRALNTLKDHRDNIAHFLVMTGEDKTEVIKQADHVLAKITAKDLSAEQRSELKDLSDSYAKLIEYYIDADVLADITKASDKVFNFKRNNATFENFYSALHGYESTIRFIDSGDEGEEDKDQPSLPVKAKK